MASEVQPRSNAVHAGERVKIETLVTDEDWGQDQPMSFEDDDHKQTHGPDNVKMDLSIRDDDDSNTDEEHVRECGQPQPVRPSHNPHEKQRKLSNERDFPPKLTATVRESLAGACGSVNGLKFGLGLGIQWPKTTGMWFGLWRMTRLGKFEVQNGKK
ncbi:hypothetical protein CRG98_036565 [Punica granatum]|uniref:Uncharacterized protein n=1 Tax=Punica granatum TaxID=22663 RepID=A0A2I0IID8_PUNGR|nr:hypothetical protein CRG98_036565 [Punica granatum]